MVDGLDRPVVETVRYWLPSDLPGHVLTTSRSPLGEAPVGLAPLPPDAATRLLLDRTDDGDAAAARAIAERLGHLPLALVQAAAYLALNPWRTLSDYAGLEAAPPEQATRSTTTTAGHVPCRL